MGTYPLDAGEQVLWSGRSQRPQRWFFEHLALGGCVVLMVLLFVAPEVGIGQYPDFTLYPVLFALMIGVLGPRLRNRRALALATVYLATDRRLVFAAEWPRGAEFRWVPLSALGQPVVREHEHGLGTITFGGSRWHPLSRPASGAWAPFIPVLRRIPDAHHVTQLLRQLQDQQTVLY